MNRMLAMAILTGLLVGYPGVSMADQLEELSKSVVFLMATPTGPKSEIGTGFLIAKGQIPMLVTAEHVARKIGPDSLAVVRGSRGDALPIPLHKLTGSQTGVDWNYCRVADLAVACLKPIPEVRADLERRFLPMEMIRPEPSAPPRAYTLTVLGFPLALGVSGKFSPISRETKPASGLLLIARADTKTEATFFVTQDPSVGGFSGAPVLDTGLPYSSDEAAMVADGRPLQIVGVVHGTISDDTGGKMGAITPAHLLREFLADQCKH